MTLAGRKIIYLVTEDWYFCSHRLSLGLAAKSAGADVVVATRIKEHRTHIEEGGLRVLPIQMDRSGTNPFADVATIRQITALYRHEKPDLVHHVALKPILYGGYAAVNAGIPNIINAVAGMGFMFISNSVFAKLARPFISMTQRILMNRENTRTILQNPDDMRFYIDQIGVSSDNLTIIPGSGVNVDKFSQTPEPNGIPIAVCVSRMLRDKGIYELVDATRILHAKGIKIRVKLVGPPPLLPNGIVKV